MKLMDRIDNYLYDREYKIIIKSNEINIPTLIILIIILSLISGSLGSYLPKYQ